MRGNKVEIGRYISRSQPIYTPMAIYQQRATYQEISEQKCQRDACKLEKVAKLHRSPTREHLQVYFSIVPHQGLLSTMFVLSNVFTIINIHIKIWILDNISISDLSVKYSNTDIGTGLIHCQSGIKLGMLQFYYMDPCGHQDAPIKGCVVLYPGIECI